MPFDQEREKFKFPCSFYMKLWSSGSHNGSEVILWIWGCVWYKQHGLSWTARMALKLVSKNVNQYHYWLNNIFHMKENNLWSAVNKNWKTWKISSFFFSKLREMLLKLVSCIIRKSYFSYAPHGDHWTTE